MNILNDIFNVNINALKDSISKLVYVPILAIMLIVMVLAENSLLVFLSSFNGSTNFIMGFLRYIISVIFLSAIIAILEDIVIYGKFRVNTIFSSYARYFNQISSSYFYIVLVEWLFLSLFRTSALFLIIFRYLLASILAMYHEEIYIGNEYGTNVFISMFEFIKDNLLQWIGVLIVFVILNNYFYNSIVLFTIFSFSDLKFMIEVIVSSLLLSFVMIYKGHLFNILNGSNIRKRAFQRKY